MEPQIYRKLGESETFTLVICSFDTINHLAASVGTLRALELISRNVSLGGYLIFDFVTHLGFLNYAGVHTWKEDGWETLELNCWDPINAKSHARIYVQPPAANLIYVEDIFELAISISEVEVALRSMSFSSITLYDFDGFDRPANTETRRVIVVAKFGNEIVQPTPL
ncbi:MAG: hypothetical protein U1F87_04890 [Kiritimatiellia bacterium]